MQDKNTLLPPKTADAIQAIVGVPTTTKPDTAPAPLGFLDFKQLCERLPLGERTLRELIKRRLIPFVRLPGARRLLFDWDNVRAALLRHQQGGPGL
jgi:excisionase family DNA binding protein